MSTYKKRKFRHTKNVNYIVTKHRNYIATDNGFLYSYEKQKRLQLRKTENYIAAKKNGTNCSYEKRSSQLRKTGSYIVTENGTFCSYEKQIILQLRKKKGKCCSSEKIENYITTRNGKFYSYEKQKSIQIRETENYIATKTGNNIDKRQQVYRKEN